jgi:NAD(P)-dependent dehydrogenase (short-subunit alcohol dehydrogenase family)
LKSSLPCTKNDIDSVALVTGAASGIGRAVAHTFVAEGCTRLVLADLNGDGLQTVSNELTELDSSVQTRLVTCDVSQEDQVQRMVDEAVEAFGAIHYAVNNAGISSKPRVRTHELEVEAYDRVQNVNQRGVWLCERAELRQMLTQEPELRSRFVHGLEKRRCCGLTTVAGPAPPLREVPLSIYLQLLVVFLTRMLVR